MGYAEDMRAFGEWTLENRLNSTARLLYMRIRWMFDRKGDPKKLAISSSLLMEMEGLTEPTFRRARKALTHSGLIEVVSVNGQPAVYTLLSIVKNELKEPSFEPSSDASLEPSSEPSGLARGCAGARATYTYVPGISKNNIIYYNSSLSRNLSGNSEGGTEGEAGERPDEGTVTEYIRQTGLDVDAQLFMRLNDAAGWKDGNGQPIRNWRIWLAGFAARYPKSRADKRPTAFNFEQREYKPGELDYLFDWMQKYDDDAEELMTQ